MQLRLIAITALLGACQGTSPFFPSESASPGGAPLVDKLSPPSSVSPPVDKKLYWGSQGLSHEDERTPEQLEAIAGCLLAVDQCMVEYRGEVMIMDRHDRGVPRDAPVTEAEKTLMQRYINGCERCGQVCGLNVLAGNKNPWPMCVALPGAKYSQEVVDDFYGDETSPPPVEDEERFAWRQEQIGDHWTREDEAWEQVHDDLAEKFGEHYFHCGADDPERLLKELQALRRDPQGYLRKRSSPTWWHSEMTKITQEKVKRVLQAPPSWMRGILPRVTAPAQ